MKKIMIASAAAICGLMAFGTDGIESVNVVGFNTDTITKQTFNMVSVPFEGLDGKGFKLNACLGGENLTGAPGSEEADQIKIWDPATGIYDNWYYYVEEGMDEYTGWWDVITGVYMFEDKYPEGLPAGSTFWYLSPANAAANGAMRVTGQVPNAADVTLEIVKGTFNMVAFPYPVAFSLNDTALVDWSNATGAPGSEEADQIKIWDSATGIYDNWYYYVEEGMDEYTGWWDVITGVYMFEDKYPDGLPVGKPFWYLAVGTGTFDLTFKNPVK